jgi:peptidoglycan/LPS O-acetylase OafA/YrhL
MSDAVSAVTGRLRSIQGLRAVAVLLVVLYHAGLPIGAGYVGVDVFFVISGFVITRLLVSRSADTLHLDLPSFWAGRVRRLAPALTVATLLTLLLSVPFAGPVGTQHDVGITAVASVAWVANVILAVLTTGYFADASAQNPLLHMWSLAVEEQFYLAFPILVVLVLWWVRRRRGTLMTSPLAVAVGVATVLSYVASVAITYADLPLGVGPTLAFYAPVTRAWEFGAGALVVLCAGRRAPQRPRLVAVTGAVALAASLVLIDDPSVFPGYIAILPVVGAALLCWSANADHGDLLASPPMVWIGDRSYGWYLFHWPLIVLTAQYVTAGGAALLGLVLADLSFRYVEEPIRHRQRLSGWSAPRLWFVCAVPVVCCSALLIVASGHYWWNPSVKAFAMGVSRGEHPVQSRCQSPTPVGERDMASCTFGPRDDPNPIILVGDSNAGMYADMAVAAAKKAGRRITVATIPSCQLADVATARPGVRRSFALDCHARYADTLAWLGRQPRSTVLVVSGSSIPDLDRFILVGPAGEKFVTGAQKRRAWAASLSRAYAAVQHRGHRVVPVELIPQWAESDGSGWSPRECQLVDLVRDPAKCERMRSRVEMDHQQRLTLSAMHAAAASAGVTPLAVRDTLCPDELCGTSRDGRGLYSDSAHLSADGAELLLPRFTRFMSRSDDGGQ